MPPVRSDVTQPSFRVDPITCIRRLSREHFRLVTRSEALRGDDDLKISPLLAKLDSALPGGLAAVPAAWEPLGEGVPLAN